MPDIPSLGQDAARVRTELPPPEEQETETPAPKVVVCRTAFIVVWTEAGEVGITTELDTVLLAERPPTRDEIFAAGMIIAKDRAIEETVAEATGPVAVATSDRTVALVEARQREAFAAQQNAAVKAALAKGNPHA